MQLPWKWIAAAAVAIAIAVGWFVLPVGEWMQALNKWIQGLGVWGGFVYALVYILGTVVLAPGAPLSIGAGLAFGVGWGLLIVVVSATVGATLAFLVARYLARRKVEALVKERPRFNAVDRAVEEEGWKVVALLRLSPLVPFNLQNYFFGLTNIDIRHYVPTTFIGIMPGALLYVYLGAAGKAALAGGGEGSGGALKWTLFAVGLLATAVVTVFVSKKAKAKLDEIGVEPEDDTQ